MQRLIEVHRVEDGQPPLAVCVGDVLLIRAFGGRIRDGDSVVQLWGPFLPAVVGTHGCVLSPMGAPNSVLVRALKAGSAVLEVFQGDPWRSPKKATLEVRVEP